MKKLLRSLLVLAPGLQDVRFRTEARLLRALDRPFRAEFGGLRAIAPALGSAPLVLDIGCNRGIAISTIRSMMPGARVVGFEANPDLAAATARFFAADPRVEVRAVALDAHAGEGTLHLPVYRGYRFDGLASFDRAHALSHFDRGLVFGYDETRVVLEERRVAFRTLDGQGLAPSVIKLYVQGHERAVLAGGAETLARHEPIVLAPAYDREVDALLRPMGYACYGWRKDRFGSVLDGDYVAYYATSARARQTGMIAR